MNYSDNAILYSVEAMESTKHIFDEFNKTQLLIASYGYELG